MSKDFITCKECIHIYWKDSSTGICQMAYCDITNEPTIFNPEFEQFGRPGGAFKCKNIETKRRESEAENRTNDLPSCNSCAHNGTWSCIKCSGFDGYEKSEDK